MNAPFAHTPVIIRIFASVLILLLLGTGQWLTAQTLEEYTVAIIPQDTTLGAWIEQLNRDIPATIYVPEEIANSRLQVSEAQQGSLAAILYHELSPLGLEALFHRNSIIVIGRSSDLQSTSSASYFAALEASVEAAAEATPKEWVIGRVDHIRDDGSAMLTGKITDTQQGEPIIGATVALEGQSGGTETDMDGRYQLQLPAGDHTLVVQYIGYQTLRLPVKVVSSGSLDLDMEPSVILLDQVVVEAQSRDVNIQSTQVSVTRLETKALERLPSFLGEVDIIKGLLLQPGVTTIGEGSSGFNVRGGNVDHNLILIDEGLIFNASHVLGFFGSFNPDIVRESILYKGTMPASYGGRLASALDVRMRDGSFDRLHVKGGLGLVSSRLSIDGPLVPDKTSILISARSSYSDWLLKRIQVPEVQNSSAFFYDANLRITHRFNDKHHLALNAYSTSDAFTFNNTFGFDYETLMGQLQYRATLGNNWLASSHLVWSRYRSDQTDLEGVDASLYETGLSYWKAKQNLQYLSPIIEANLGISAITYLVDGNRQSPLGELSLITEASTQDERGREWGFYGDVDFKISPRLSIIGGLRYSLWQTLGPLQIYRYTNPERPSNVGLLEPELVEDRVVHAEGHWQPRLSFRYNLSASSSIKGGYGRTVQYFNQVYNSETPTPTSFWKLSNAFIPPQLAHNYSLGYFQNFADNIWETSVEFYYRDIDQLWDFRPFADLPVNEHLETELLDGIGRTYGMELSIRRQIGFVHGWLNYTYSRTERQVNGINDGSWYPSNFDKPHDITLVANLQLNKRNTIAFNFVYGTGRPITIPIHRYLVQDRVVVLNYSDRNAFRIPDYHRLDVAYTLGQGLRKSKKFKTSWTFSVYNVYARKNPYSVFLNQDPTSATRIQRLAVLGSAFPALTFNFELL